jgi:hypothetical protein
MRTPSSVLALFDSLIQRLQNARVDGGNHIHRRIQFFFGHSRFPCVRKASLDSEIAQSHHRHSQSDEHLFSIRETLDGMRVTIESAKISLLQRITPFGFAPGLGSRSGKLET